MSMHFVGGLTGNGCCCSKSNSILPIYSSFAKEGNHSDLFAKGEAISTVFNVLGIGLGIQLVSTLCSSMQGKVYIYSPVI